MNDTTWNSLVVAIIGGGLCLVGCLSYWRASTHDDWCHNGITDTDLLPMHKRVCSTDKVMAGYSISEIDTGCMATFGWHRCDK